MRGRLINWRFVGPLLAVIAIALIAATTAFHLVQPNAENRAHSEGALSRQLAACRAMGKETASSPTCLSTWKENRRRFFDETRQGRTTAGATGTAKGATQP